jgi:predicted phage tail component-like protein
MAGGFSFLGVHSDTYNITVTEIDLPILPPARLSQEEIPGRPGVYVFRSELGPRTIRLRCKFRASSLAGLLSLARDIGKWLQPYRDGQLILDEEPDKYYRARLAKEITATVRVAYGEFEAEFLAADPFAYAVADDEFNTTSSPFSFSRRGTAASNPLIRLTGTSSGGSNKLKLQVNGRGWVAYSGALSSGQKLQLDIDRLTATVVDASNIYVRNALGDISGADLTSLRLEPGQNSIEVAVEGSATWSNLYILCRSRWY